MLPRRLSLEGRDGAPDAGLGGPIDGVGRSRHALARRRDRPAAERGGDAGRGCRIRPGHAVKLGAVDRVCGRRGDRAGSYILNLALRSGHAHRDDAVGLGPTGGGAPGDVGRPRARRVGDAAGAQRDVVGVRGDRVRANRDGVQAGGRGSGPVEFTAR